MKLSLIENISDLRFFIRFILFNKMTNIDDAWRSLFEIIEYINQTKIYKEMNFVWTKYESFISLKLDFNRIQDSIKKKEKNAIQTISTLFAPTGTLQELSIDNDWTDEYIKISTKVDILISLINEQGTPHNFG